ncbi:MAG: tetratricopeptide repeat protein [Candidatus Melainabacteria bacterium]|nr:tetratricopeptide repeat protein [Candidatus Melainabacteria bacterium]
MSAWQGKVKSIISAGMLVALLATMNIHWAQAEPASQSSPAITPLSQAKAKLHQGKAKEAMLILEKLIQSEPKNGEALLNLGMAYKRTKDYAKAKSTLILARRAVPGTAIAQQANDELLKLPRKIIAPRGKPAFAYIRVRRVAPAGLTRVKLIAFYASWAQPCKQLQADMEKVKAQWGDKVELVTIDVDDPKNEQLVEEYDVSPIPTVVFLNEAGQMVSFLIGYSGEGSLHSQIRSLTAGAKPTAPTS